MKKIITLFVFIMISLFVFSQENEIKSIREMYGYVQQEIAGQKDDDLPANNTHIVINQMMPAIGSQTVEYYFYFELKELEDDVSFQHDLYFVSRNYNVGESMNVYEEFLFDKSGNLLFYFQNTREEKCKQLRCYFEDNELIKVLYKEADLNEENECPSATKYNVVLQSKNKLPEDIGFEYIKGTADDLKTIFKLLDK